MKHLIVLSLFGFNLMTATAYAQPLEPIAASEHVASSLTSQQLDNPKSATVNPKPSSLTNNAMYQSVSQTSQPVNQHALIPLQTSTVATAKTLKDDTPVRVQGQVIRALGKDKYEFRDATGTLIAEIDNQKWHGSPITQQAQVILIGEIDRESDHTIELDVDEVRTIAATP